LRKPCVAFSILFNVNMMLRNNLSFKEMANNVYSMTFNIVSTLYRDAEIYQFLAIKPLY
jgi:hypothetical protein